MTSSQKTSLEADRKLKAYWRNDHDLPSFSCFAFNLLPIYTLKVSPRHLNDSTQCGILSLPSALTTTTGTIPTLATTPATQIEHSGNTNLLSNSHTREIAHDHGTVHNRDIHIHQLSHTISWAGFLGPDLTS